MIGVEDRQSITVIPNAFSPQVAYVVDTQVVGPSNFRIQSRGELQLLAGRIDAVEKDLYMKTEGLSAGELCDGLT